MKILVMLVMLLTFTLSAWADQPTTVLHEPIARGGLTGSQPVLDGNMDVNLQKAANRALRQLVDDLAKQMDRRGTIDFTVTLNRASLVAMQLHGHSEGGRDFYQAANIDLTTGRAFTLGDFFQATEARELALDGANADDVLFAEDGVYTHTDTTVPYLTCIPYGKLVPSCRIGDIGRILPVWRLTEDCAGRTLEVPTGSLMALRVAGNPATGYRWLPAVSGGTGNLYLLGSTFTMQRVDADVPGAAGYEIVVLTAQTAGEYEVKMQYRRPWEARGVVKEFAFTVRVK